MAETLKGSFDEKEIFEKLGVDEGKFTEFMRAFAAQTEDAVLGQELSVDENGGGRRQRLPARTKRRYFTCQ